MPDSPLIANPLADWTPSGVHFEDETGLRDVLGAWFRSHEGLRSSGETEPFYEQLIFPTDEPIWRHGYADDAWSCACRYRAALYHLKVKHPLVTCPYQKRVGHAVADVATVARSYKAIYEGPSVANYQPRPGDALCSLGGAGPHVSCVTAAEWRGERLVLTCADGGQGHRGSMAVDRNEYEWLGTALRSVEGPDHSLERPGPKRPLLWTISTWDLLLNADVLASR